MLAVAEAVYKHLYEKRKRRFESGTVSVQEVTGKESLRIVSVGNITVGGTGKTPTVQWIARYLHDKGHNVAIVARGYKGRLSDSGAVVSDGVTIFLNAEEAGDEPVIHARSLPGVSVVIGRDRVTAVQRAVEQFQSDVIVLDDAFQYWSLPRDFNLVLLDARQPFDNGHLLPRGRLREPPSALQRADSILLTRCNRAETAQLEATKMLVAQQTKAPIFCSNHKPVAIHTDTVDMPLKKLQGMRVGAVSALADNDAFIYILEQCGATVVTTLGRRDHHAWRAEEIAALSERALASGAEALLTTEKDAVKIDSSWSAKLRLWCLRVELDLGDDEGAFKQLLNSFL